MNSKRHPKLNFLEVFEDGKIFSHRSKKFIKGSMCGKYLKINLGDLHTGWVHKIIAETLISNPNNKTQVNHKDGNKLNNNPNNLEWVSAGENLKHAWELGLMYKSNYKFTDDIRKKCQIMYNSGNYTKKELANIFQISPGYLNSIIKREY